MGTPSLHRAAFLGCSTLIGGVLVVSPIFGQEADRAERPSIDDAIAIGIDRLLEMQEGDGPAEWPYEGVYRVIDPDLQQRVIPIGYRVGGTAICALALMHAPEYEADERRCAAVERAARFIVEQVDHPLMASDEIVGTYDVRGWGYTYGLLFLLEYRSGDVWGDARLPAGQGGGEVAAASQEAMDNAIRFFIAGVNATEIPRSGGWNYARRGGFDQPGPISPFMTAPTLQALFEAREKGYEVDENVVERGLDALEQAKLRSGAYVYSGTSDRQNERARVPGAAGRMAAAEATLYLAGRSTLADVRGAIDAFLVHWDWLDQRRAKTGTHLPPYGIAPYYFYFAHYYAAQAVELLPDQDREEYRRRIRDLLFRNRLEDGGWNDRVFERTANFGTAMALMVLEMNDSDLPPRWRGDE